jgi:hypothetical protein
MFFLSFFWTIAAVGACGINAGSQSNRMLSDTANLPLFIKKELIKSFPEWRVKVIADLDSMHHDVWAKVKHAESPGIITGRFKDNDTSDYVLLLVPKQKNRNDYMVVLFSKSGNGQEHDYHQIAAEKNQILERVVINKIPAGTRVGAEEQLELKNDGIQVEDLEVGSIIYYWFFGHFNKVIESD